MATILELQSPIPQLDNYGGPYEMTTNVVNLDALIPREDFAVEAQPPFVSTIEKISITHLVLCPGNMFTKSPNLLKD